MQYLRYYYLEVTDSYQWILSSPSSLLKTTSSSVKCKKWTMPECETMRGSSKGFYFSLFGHSAMFASRIIHGRDSVIFWTQLINQVNPERLVSKKRHRVIENEIYKFRTAFLSKRSSLIRSCTEYSGIGVERGVCPWHSNDYQSLKRGRKKEIRYMHIIITARTNYRCFGQWISWKEYFNSPIHRAKLSHTIKNELIRYSINRFLLNYTSIICTSR